MWGKILISINLEEGDGVCQTDPICVNWTRNWLIICYSIAYSMYPVAIDFLSILCGLGDAFENIKIFINLTWFHHGQELEKKAWRVTFVCLL